MFALNKVKNGPNRAYNGQKRARNRLKRAKNCVGFFNEKIIFPFSIQRATTGYILDPSLEDFSIYNAKKDLRQKESAK